MRGHVLAPVLDFALLLALLVAACDKAPPPAPAPPLPAPAPAPPPPSLTAEQSAWVRDVCVPSYLRGSQDWHYASFAVPRCETLARQAVK